MKESSNAVASRSPTSEALIALSALSMVLVAQWMLSGAIHGTNYYGFDGKMVQSAALTAFKFSGYFDVTSISPIHGIGSQLLPKNVWANPAFWPFAFLDKERATDVSALIAFGVFATAVYIMMRCFDLPVLPSALAAQASIVLFAPALLIVYTPTNFCLTPGDAVVYAPYMAALGILARLEPGSWRAFILATIGISALVLYSIWCDPLWTLIAAISWMVPFAIVALGPLQVKPIATRVAALGCCLVFLWVSGAANYLYTLSQFTARVQYADIVDRARGPQYVSSMTYSPNMKYFYLGCAIGWLVGMVVLRNRARLLVFAALGSFVVWVAYSVVYLLLLNAAWVLPIPRYLEHGAFALYLGAAVAGYWGVLSTAEALFAHGMTSLVQRFGHLVGRSTSADSWAKPSDQRWAPPPVLRRIAVGAAIVVVAILPARAMQYALTEAHSKENIYYEPWPNEAELMGFLVENVGVTTRHAFRGAINYLSPVGFTMAESWSRSIPTANEYSQLITPDAFYFMHALVNRDITGNLNAFNLLWARGTYSPGYWTALAMLGMRYGLATFPLPEPFHPALPSISKPHRPSGPDQKPGSWYIYELSNPNVGHYSPTEVITGKTAAEIMASLRMPDFDFTRRVVLSTPLTETLVPARDMRLSIIRGGLHVSGRSSGTSLAVLPQQFSHCLRPVTGTARLMRANLLATAIIFSGDLDTDIVFDYGIFSPGCRFADMVEFKQLDMKIDQRMPHLTGDLFPEWHDGLARLRAAADAIR